MDTMQNPVPGPLTVLFAPAHVLVDATKEGSEYYWPYKLIEYLALDHGMRIVALTVSARVDHALPNVEFVSVDPAGPLPMSNLERLHFHLRVYATARRILGTGQRFDVVHHMLPFGFRATFNLLALLPRRGDPPLVIGPLQSPLSYTGPDEARVAARDFSVREDEAPARRRAVPPLSTFVTIPVLSALSTQTLRRAKALVMISEQAERLYGSLLSAKDKGGAGNGKSARGASLPIIPAGVDTREFTPVEPEPDDGVSAPGRPIEIVAVGYLMRRKAFDVVIRAVARLVASGVLVHLRLVGEGPQRARLERLAVELAVADHVTFAGLISHHTIVHEYRRADIFCSMSLSESFSIVGLEAMSCGLPILATPTGFFREVLRREQVGLAVRFGDDEGLATALRRLAADSSARQDMGRRARKLAVREYDWRVVAARYAALYHQVVGRDGI